MALSWRLPRPLNCKITNFSKMGMSSPRAKLFPLASFQSLKLSFSCDLLSKTGAFPHFELWCLAISKPAELGKSYIILLKAVKSGNGFSLEIDHVHFTERGAFSVKCAWACSNSQFIRIARINFANFWKHGHWFKHEK